MATQTIEIRSEYANEANTVCRARNPDTDALVQSSPTLAAPTASGVRYFPQFTDLPAGEYLFVLESSSGDELTWGFATVTLETATFLLQGVRASEAASSVTVTDVSTAALAKFATVDTGETTAAAGSVARIAQGGAVDNSAQLTRIENQTGLITAGSISVVSPVSPGGDITLVIGDDYLGSEVINLQVSDAGETLKTFLEAATSIIFGGGRGVDFNQVTGTIDKTALTHSAGTNTTTIPIAIASVPGRAGTDYTYHVKAIVAGKEHTKVSGNLTLQSERARPTT